MSRFSLPLAAVIACWTSCASANWLTIHQKDEFDGKDRYLAVTSATEPWFGFVCEVDTGRFKFFYKTKERPSGTMRKLLPIQFMKIALIIDDDPVRTYSGSLVESTKRLSSQSYDRSVIDLALIVSRATRRVLIANDLGGDKYHQHEFNVDGAHRAISMLLRRCAKL